MTLLRRGATSTRNAHSLEPGWTYWLGTVSGELVRFDFTETIVWVLFLGGTDALVADGWSRVVDREVVVIPGARLTLRLAGPGGAVREWVGAAVTRLDRSSKERLPASVW